MKCIVVCLSLIFSALSFYGQENQEKFWNYKHRLVSERTKVGIDPGCGIPVTSRPIGVTAPNDVLNVAGSRSSLKYADSGYNLGHYLIELATELKNLKETPLLDQSRVESTRRELFLALTTLMRLDYSAENYLLSTGGDLTSVPSLITSEDWWSAMLQDCNGFFLRDDVPYEFSENFEGDYSLAFNREANIVMANSDAKPTSSWDFEVVNDCGQETGEIIPGGTFTEHNDGAGMSIDQVIPILDGLLMTFSLLDDSDNVHVDFLQNNSEFDQNLPQLARILGIKIIDYILRPVPGKSGHYSCNIKTPYLDNGVIKFGFRPAGYDATFYAPLIIDLAARFKMPFWTNIAGTEYENLFRIQFQMDGGELGCNMEPIGFCQDYIDNIVDQNRVVGLFSIRLDHIRDLYEEVEEQNIRFQMDESSDLDLSPKIINVLKDVIFHLDLYDDSACDEFNTLLQSIVSNPFEFGWNNIMANYVMPLLMMMINPSIETSDQVMWDYAQGTLSPVDNHLIRVAIYAEDTLLPVMLLTYRNKANNIVHDMFCYALIVLSQPTVIGGTCLLTAVFNGDCEIPLLEVPSSMMTQDNVRMINELAAISNVWSHNYLTTNVLNANRDYQFDISYLTLINRLLYDADFVSQPLLTGESGNISLGIPRQHFEMQYLNQAPCLGPWDDFNAVYNSSDHGTPVVEGQNENWKSNNILLNPQERRGLEVNSFRGEYSGIDYMALYNLYHLNYKDQLEPYKKSLNCDCVQEFTYENQISQSFDIESKFPEYADYRIPIESFLAHNLYVGGTSPIVLGVKNDVIVCSTDPSQPTTWTIGGSTVVNLYKGYSITVKAGNSLRFLNGAVINAGKDWGSLNNDKFRIILESGAKLQIDNSILNYDFSGLEILAEDGSEINIFNSQINRSFTLGGGNIVGEDVVLRIRNCEMNTDQNSQPWDVRLEKSSFVSIKDCDLNIGASSFTITDESSIKIEQSQVVFNKANVYVTTNSTMSFEDTQLILKGASTLSLNGGSELIQYNGGFNVIEDSEVNIGALKDYEPLSRYKYYGGDVIIEDENSRMLFDGGELYIMPDQTFAPFDLVQSTTGYLEFSNKLDMDIYADATSVFSLKGKGIDDKILVINEWANMQNANFGLGKMFITDGLVDLSAGGQIWTDMEFVARNVNFVDEQSDLIVLDNHYPGSDIKVYFNNSSKVDECVFNSVQLNNYDGRMTVDSSSFVGVLSGFRSIGGRYKMLNSSFENCRLYSNGLISQATISLCSFKDPFERNAGFEVYRSSCIEDLSLEKIFVDRCTFDDAFIGVIQKDGTLAVKCSKFDGISKNAIEKTGGDLEMSVSIGSGYNKFRNCFNGVYLRNALTCELFDGYNDFSGIYEKVIYGTLPFECDPGSCHRYGNAEHNFWGESSSNSNQPGAVDFSTPQEQNYPIYITSSIDNCGSFESGAACEFHFTDLNPTYPVPCNSVTPRVKPEKSAQGTNMDGASQKSGQNDSGEWTNKNLNDSLPLINTVHFENVALDSALQVAASYLLDFNEEGSDEEAIALFHEIITSGLNTQDTLTSYMLEWGRKRMKPAIERLLEDSIDVTELNPSVTFDAYTQMYVDVLNTLTDTVLTRATYKTQFYRELDKAQLFRMLGRSDIAQFIFEHLDDCALDSTEQVVLNFWISRSIQDLELESQYIVENVSPDSIDVTDFSYSFPELVSVTASNYYFGLWINGPENFEFVGCGEDNVWNKSNSSYFKFVIAPNPNDGQFVINGPFCKDAKIQLFDPNGRSIKSIKVNSDVRIVQVDARDFPSSWATIRIESCGNIWSDRVVFVH